MRLDIPRPNLAPLLREIYDLFDQLAGHLDPRKVHQAKVALIETAPLNQTDYQLRLAAVQDSDTEDRFRMLRAAFLHETGLQGLTHKDGELLRLHGRIKFHNEAQRQLDAAGSTVKWPGLVANIARAIADLAGTRIPNATLLTEENQNMIILTARLIDIYLYLRSAEAIITPIKNRQEGLIWDIATITEEQALVEDLYRHLDQASLERWQTLLSQRYGNNFIVRALGHNIPPFKGDCRILENRIRYGSELVAKLHGTKLNETVLSQGMSNARPEYLNGEMTESLLRCLRTAIKSLGITPPDNSETSILAKITRLIQQALNPQLQPVVSRGGLEPPTSGL